MTRDQLALLADARLSPGARVLGLYVAGQKDEWVELGRDDARRLLGPNTGKDRIARDLGDLEAYGYLERRAGGKGHPDRFRFSVRSTRTVSPDSVRDSRTVNEPVGGDKGGGVVLSSSTVSQTELAAKDRGPKPRGKPIKELPSDWTPNEKHRQLARDRGVSVELEAEKMRDWAATKGERCVDWDARFRNWLRTARPDPNAGRPNGIHLRPDQFRTQLEGEPVVTKTRMQVDHERRLRAAGGT